MSQAIQLPFSETPEMQAARLVVPKTQNTNLAQGGAEYHHDFISKEEEDDLIAAIDKENWIQDLRRRVQHYGYQYDYTKRKLTKDDKIGALPAWTETICHRLVKQGVFDTPPDQLIVNEYEPGHGIAPHTDRDCFGPVLAGISLGSDCCMDIYPDAKIKKSAFPIVLERRSLLVLGGIARKEWLHGIRPNKSDTQNGHKVPRERRISLTFRTVI